MLLKYVVLLLITIVLQLIFTLFFRLAIKQVHEGYSEENANQMHILLKYTAFVLVFVFFILILLWDFIGFARLTFIHKVIVSLFFFYFLGYCKSAIGMVDHFVCLIYRPDIAGSVEYDGTWGEFKIVDNKPMIIHEFAWLHLDISNRL